MSEITTNAELLSLTPTPVVWSHDELVQLLLIVFLLLVACSGR